MNGQEIREKIDLNRIRINMALNKFVLNQDIQVLMEENETLRKICPHCFENGVCIYCDMLEEDFDD